MKIPLIFAAVAIVAFVWLAVITYKIASQSPKSANGNACKKANRESDCSNISDDITVAVITAALAAYMAGQSEDGTYRPFRVVSFKRKKKGFPWNGNI